MNDALDLLYRLLPCFAAAPPTWWTVRTVSNRWLCVDSPLKRQWWLRLALVVASFAVYGSIALLVLHRIWPGGISVWEWLAFIIPVSMLVGAGSVGMQREQPRAAR